MSRLPLWATGTQSPGDHSEKVWKSPRTGPLRNMEMYKVAWWWGWEVAAPVEGKLCRDCCYAGNLKIPCPFLLLPKS